MIQIGNLKINGKYILAPLAGYSDSPYRKIARRHGSALTVTELISSEGIVRKIWKTMELLEFTEEERPISIQIFGSQYPTKLLF